MVEEQSVGKNIISCSEDERIRVVHTSRSHRLRIRLTDPPAKGSDNRRGGGGGGGAEGGGGIGRGKGGEGDRESTTPYFIIKYKGKWLLL